MYELCEYFKLQNKIYIDWFTVKIFYIFIISSILFY